ncbi:Sec-independent protein translocase protein TatB [Umezawaea endophytica]|uniref:Sec-independent protein translocase protein TatB n=1 Tax=Umezawaea endophytica TaxID=1654476 RepID=A0A9X2VQS7_9PSEU|nr:Sec-independent protein translocase protein TatB [Umezawaea endophytica]MCS7479753.1 Sec-independent protein translocase protein TatB [Umezawaea endophytica]
MFDSIGWVEVLIIVVAGLFILGPERLPEAAGWVGRTIRQVRDYATGAREQLKQEMGPEFEQLRKPLEDLRELRNFDPKKAVTKHLFDDPAPVEKPNGYPVASPAPAPVERPLSPGERAPYDPDAT